jgi:hypothetical protein
MCVCVESDGGGGWIYIATHIIFVHALLIVNAIGPALSGSILVCGDCMYVVSFHHARTYGLVMLLLVF